MDSATNTTEVSMKEVKELFTGLSKLSECADKIMADGKVSLTDLPALVTALKDYTVISEAFKGLDQIKIADLLKKENAEEVIALVTAFVFEAIQAAKKDEVEA